MNRRTLVPSLLFALIPFLALSLSGCVSPQEAHASRQQAVDACERLAAISLGLESELATLAPLDPARPALEARLSQTRASISSLSDGIATIDAALRSTLPPDDPAIDLLADILPVPWRAPLLLGGVGLGLFVRSRQLRAGITTIAQGIDVAKGQDPLFKASFERHANTFRSIQSPLARKLVDTVTDRIANPAQTPSGATGVPATSPESVTQESTKKSAATYSQS